MYLAKTPRCWRWSGAIAEMLGKPAALFVPSGTMGNQIGVRLHCQAGDEFLCDAGCHIYCYEQGAYAQLFGIAAHPVPTDDGVLTVEHLEDQVRRNNVHYPLTKLVCLENTHNRGAGRVLPYDGDEGDLRVGERRGARSASRWRAAVQRRGGERDSGVAVGEQLRHDQRLLQQGAGRAGGFGDRWARGGDRARAAASQGAGRRHAAGGDHRRGALYALEHHVERLAEDHANAKLIAAAVNDSDCLTLDPPHASTPTSSSSAWRPNAAPRRSCARS